MPAGGVRHDRAARMRVGLFGGTFNPVHLGHLRSALEVQEGVGLDQVILIPAAVPPHKGSGELAGAAERLEMIAAAVEGVPGLAASDVETRRAGPSFTIDTVRHFRDLLAQAELFLIVGLDAFLEIDTWRSFRELLELVPLIVISRPAGGLPPDGEPVERFIRARISPECSVDRGSAVYQAPGVRGIRIFPVTALDLSSSRIRELVRAGRSIRYLVPERVHTYIQNRGLYR
jgi:nicotinate-nucleotide adenylyltransferase